jgi:two-component system, LuxR family, sensor kinase FixL
MTEAEEQGLTLETITHATQAMAGQISVEGVATTLLNAGLTVSGAPRGVTALWINSGFNVGDISLSLTSADIVKSRPALTLEHFPAEIWRSAVTERAVQIRFLQDQPTAFPDPAGIDASVSALCAPVVSQDAVNGFLYLEFDHGADLMTNRRLATTSLLSSQAAMTLDAIKAFDGVRTDPIWQTRNLIAGRVATFRWNPRERLSEGPPEFYALLGLDPAMGPINYSTMTKLQHPADYPRSQATVDDAVKRGGPLCVQWRLLRPNGEIRNLLWSGQFDAVNPDDPWLRGVVMDITDLKAADDALRAAQEDADRQLRLAWMGELSGSIVHEVSQPLGAVISSAEAALRWLDRDPPDVMAAIQSLERIRETGLAAARIVAGMRALSSNFLTEPADRSLNAIAAEALRLSGPLLSRVEVRVEVFFDSAQPLVHCDASQILQVLLNLVRNAIDSLRDVEGRDRVLKVRTFVELGRVVAQIEDNGVGLTPDVAERLFNPLYTTKKDGMGLGLSICRRIMAAHLGDITAKANPEFGAVFTLSVPKA